MAECEHIEACRMAYGGEGCKPACDLDLPCHLYEPKVDRDALLKLADEIELDGAGSLDDGDWCKPLLVEYARRIRDALGVER